MIKEDRTAQNQLQNLGLVCCQQKVDIGSIAYEAFLYKDWEMIWCLQGAMVLERVGESPRHVGFSGVILLEADG